MNTFDFIENSFRKKNNTTSLTKQLDSKESVFMMCRWSSMHPLSFLASYLTSQYATKIPKWASCCLFYHNIKKGNPPQLNYIKKDNKKNTEIKNKILKKVMSYYNCSSFHAEQILIIYKNKDINIYNAFGINGKENK